MIHLYIGVQSNQIKTLSKEKVLNFQVKIWTRKLSHIMNHKCEYYEIHIFAKKN